MAKSRKRTPARRPSQPARQQGGQQQPTAVSVVMEQIESWQGPLPRPRDLEHYGQIDPTLPDRIVRMAEKTIEITEKQTDHRIWAERRTITSWNRRANIGQVLGFIVVMSVLGGSGYLINEGHTVGGSVLGGIDLASVAGIFIYGRRDAQKRENG